MHKQSKLNNGATLITAPVAGSKTTTVLVMFATGAKYEQADNNGISHFLEHMFFKGTANRPLAADIAGDLDKVGAEFNAFTSKEYTGYYVKAASQHLPLALDVLSDMLLHSKFDQEEINREKGVIIEEINMYLDNPRDYVEELFENCLYGQQPAGRDVLGPKKNIQKFTRKHFLDYYTTQYGSNSAYIVIAGKVPSTITALVNKYFQNLPANKYQKKIATKDSQNRPQIKVHYKKTDQAHLILGVRAFAHNHAQEQIAKALSVVLGGSMSSRLFTQLRERNGLCYYVRTSYERFTDTGWLATKAGVPVNKIEAAIKIILAEYDKIRTEGLGREELQKVQQLIEGRTDLQLEASDNVALWYAMQAVIIHQQKAQGQKTTSQLLDPADMIKEIKKITPQQIQNVAKKLLTNSQLNLAVVGPYRDSAKFQKILKLA